VTAISSAAGAPGAAMIAVGGVDATITSTDSGATWQATANH
jgi:hypothetical protein